MLRLLYNPALTTCCDRREDHSLDCTDLCRQSNASSFRPLLFRFVIAFLPKSNHLLISWLQSPSSKILEPKERKSVTTSAFSLSICHEVMGPDIVILVFKNSSCEPAFSLSSFTLIKRLFSYSLLSAIRVVSSSYLRLLMLPPLVLTSACNYSSSAFFMMCSAYRLNKQGDSRQPCHTPFSVLNQSVVPYRVLTCFLTHIQVSQETGKMFWCSHLSKSFPQFVMIHTVKGFSVVNETEVDVFF